MMSLINLGNIFPFPPHMCSEKVEHRPFHCVGFSKVGQVYHSEAKEAAKISHHARRRCECLDLHKQQIPYMEAWSWQKFLVRRRHILIERDEDDSDTLIILQHPPVYTLGTSSSEKYLNFDIQSSPYDIYRTERGGEVTYHGPGQLVMYPILNLRYHKMDLHWYLRSLEEVIIRVLLSTFSVKASRLEGFTGVWVGNHKVAAIGIRVSRWVTYHGLALNVTADLAPFRHIIPCGIRDREVGSLKELLGTTEDANLMDVAHKSLIKEFSEVFQLSLDYRLISELDLPEGMS